MTQLKRNWVIQCHLQDGCTGRLIRSASRLRSPKSRREDEEDPREEGIRGTLQSIPLIHQTGGRKHFPFPVGHFINSYSVDKLRREAARCVFTGTCDSQPRSATAHNQGWM